MRPESAPVPGGTPPAASSAAARRLAGGARPRPRGRRARAGACRTTAASKRRGRHEEERHGPEASSRGSAVIAPPAMPPSVPPRPIAPEEALGLLGPEEVREEAPEDGDDEEVERAHEDEEEPRGREALRPGENAQERRRRRRSSPRGVVHDGDEDAPRDARDEGAEERRDEERPRERPEEEPVQGEAAAGGRAHLLAQRADDVVAAEEEEEREPTPRRGPRPSPGSIRTKRERARRALHRGQPAFGAFFACASCHAARTAVSRSGVSPALSFACRSAGCVFHHASVSLQVSFSGRNVEALADGLRVRDLVPVRVLAGRGEPARGGRSTRRPSAPRGTPRPPT